MTNDRKEFLIDLIINQPPELLQAVIRTCTPDEIGFMAFELGCDVGAYEKLHGRIFSEEKMVDAEAKMKIINGTTDKASARNENPVLGWLSK